MTLGPASSRRASSRGGVARCAAPAWLHSAPEVRRRPWLRRPRAPVLAWPPSRQRARDGRRRRRGPSVAAWGDPPDHRAMRPSRPRSDDGLLRRRRRGRLGGASADRRDGRDHLRPRACDRGARAAAARPRTPPPARLRGRGPVAARDRPALQPDRSATCQPRRTAAAQRRPVRRSSARDTSSSMSSV